MATYYIAPAVTELAGQCRIYRHSKRVYNSAVHYRLVPDEWTEVGLMSSQGKLVCLTAPKEVWQEMRECEPMAGGMCFFNEED